MCFPVNFVKFLRAPFLPNTSIRLLLKKILLSSIENILMKLRIFSFNKFLFFFYLLSLNKHLLLNRIEDNTGP